MSFCIAFDTETTGLEAGSRPTEIAAIKYDTDTGECLDKYVTFARPGMPLPPDMPAINGITPEMIAGGKHLADAAREFSEFIVGADYLVAHNAPYDVGIISWALQFFGLPLPQMTVICTCLMARAIRATTDNKLGTLVSHYGIPLIGDAHRAESDADASYRYFRIAKYLINPTNNLFIPQHLYTDELPESLKKMPDLVMQGETLSFGYVDKKGNRTDRTIIPYGWGLVGGKLQFHGLDIEKQERRTFIADRITPSCASVWT